MSRFYKNLDIKKMRKTYFQALRQKGESTLQYSKNPRNPSFMKQNYSNIAMRLISKKSVSVQSKF